MNIFTIILATLVAIEFFYIMYIETIQTTSLVTSKTFNIPKETLQQPTVNVLLKNQGVYNGLIGVALLYATYFSVASKELVSVLLMYVVLVAIYGAMTSNKSILWKQGGLAILGLLSLLF